MPFFQQPALYPEAALFSLLSSLSDDQPQPQTKTSPSPCQPRLRQQQQKASPQTFTPKFDVTEISNSYELFGDLPGIEQRDIEIEFSDAQTIVIKGKTARRVFPSTTTPAPAPTQEPESPKEKDSETSSIKSGRSATVEDDYDEVDTPLSPATPSTPVTSEVTPAQAPVAPAQAPIQEQESIKYWVSERLVGEFTRTFSFAKRIDQDAVQASLKNGILHIVVPKMGRKGKKVVVNVL